jgi:hypothetical protein
VFFLEEQNTHSQRLVTMVSCFLFAKSAPGKLIMFPLCFVNMDISITKIYLYTSILTNSIIS